MTKPCRKCGGSERNKHGHCIPCKREYDLNYALKYKRGNEVRLATTCKRGHLDRNKHGQCVPCLALQRREQKYGITEEETQNRLVAQNDNCAICEEPLSKGFHVDHDHFTGIIRGLLCPTCNLALGLFKDDLKIILKVVDYLEKFQ